MSHFGRVDVLCNNAGVSTFNLLRDQTLDDWRWVFDVNLWGVVHGLQSFVPSRAMCTDNAAMIAAAGWHRLASDGPTSLDVGAYPGLRLSMD